MTRAGCDSEISLIRSILGDVITAAYNSKILMNALYHSDFETNREEFSLQAPKVSQ